MDKSDKIVVYETPVTQDNYKEMIRLYNQLTDIPDISTKEELLSIIKKERVWVLYFQDEPNTFIGFVAHRQESKSHAFLHLLVIDEAYRNHGIGADIIKTLRQEYQGLKIYLLSNIQNKQAHKFYENQGFMYHSDIKGKFNMCHCYILN